MPFAFAIVKKTEQLQSFKIKEKNAILLSVESRLSSSRVTKLLSRKIFQQIRLIFEKLWDRINLRFVRRDV